MNTGEQHLDHCMLAQLGPLATSIEASVSAKMVNTYVLIVSRSGTIVRLPLILHAKSSPSFSWVSPMVRNLQHPVWARSMILAWPCMALSLTKVLKMTLFRGFGCLWISLHRYELVETITFQAGSGLYRAQRMEQACACMMQRTWLFQTPGEQQPRTMQHGAWVVYGVRKKKTNKQPKAE